MVVVTDPEVAREVLHRSDLDKSRPMYAPVSQVSAFNDCLKLYDCLQLYVSKASSFVGGGMDTRPAHDNSTFLLCTSVASV